MPYTLATTLPCICIAPVSSFSSYKPSTVSPEGNVTLGRSSCHCPGYPTASNSVDIILVLEVV